MAHLIDKSALVAEIENLESTYKKCPTSNSYEEGLKDGRLIGYKDALYKIDTLEVKEVQEESTGDIEAYQSRWGKSNGYLAEPVSEQKLSNVERSIKNWKPTEEQLSALKEAFNKGSITFHDMEVLAGLYQTLIAL